MISLARKVLAAAACAVALAMLPAAGHATTYYVGIGEDEFTGDIVTATDIISAWDGIDITEGINCTACITTDLTNDVADMKSGDTLIFYYSGHGSPITDPNDPNDPNVNVGAVDSRCGCAGDANITVDNADEQIGLGSDQTAGKGITDDELTDILADVPQGATAMVILDACFGGLADQDPTDLGSLPIDFISTADGSHCAPGDFEFAPRFQSAFELGSGLTLNSDANVDGVLTEGELFDYLTNGCGTAGQFGYMDANGLASVPTCRAGNDDVNNQITSTPEPGSLLLIGTGLGLFGMVRRRRSGA